MAITLNGIALNPSMTWIDEFNYPTVDQKVVPTLDSGYRIYSRVAPSNRPITLVATVDSGWLTQEMVVAIKAIESVPKAEYTLVIRDTSYNVMFRHDDPPAFEVAPLIGRGGSLPGDYFVGTLKLFVKD